MEPISNVDRLVLILRQRLQERARASAGGRKDAKPRDTARPKASPLDTVQALAAVDSVDDRQLKRALIQGVLAETLGPGLINDASFQQMVDRVTGTLDGDPELGPLMARVVTDLRAAARS